MTLVTLLLQPYNGNGTPPFCEGGHIPLVLISFREKKSFVVDLSCYTATHCYYDFSIVCILCTLMHCKHVMILLPKLVPLTVVYPGFDVGGAI